MTEDNVTTKMELVTVTPDSTETTASLRTVLTTALAMENAIELTALVFAKTAGEEKTALLNLAPKTARITDSVSTVTVSVLPGSKEKTAQKKAALLTATAMDLARTVLATAI